MASATLLASAFGGVLFGVLADRIGRARALTLAILIYSGFTGLTATATGVAGLLVWRTLVGTGMGGVWSAGSVLVAESWPAEHRGKAAGLMQSGWIVSAAIFSPLNAQTVVFHVVPQETVLARLHQAAHNNQERENTLKKLFEETGCTGPLLEEQPVKHVKIPNLICTLPGQADSRILVTAHTDHVTAGDGTVDNWSGASMLPDLYESLHAAPRRHTFVFIGFTQEEEGLIGSRFYAKGLTPEQKAKISALVNMDSLGLSPTAVWLSHADPELAKMAGRVAGAAKLPLQSINVEKVGESDAEAFAGLHIRSITFHSVTQQTLEILHSNRDTFHAIHVDDYYTSYRFLTAYLAWIDRELDPEKPPP